MLIGSVTLLTPGAIHDDILIAFDDENNPRPPSRLWFECLAIGVVVVLWTNLAGQLMQGAGPYEGFHMGDVFEHNAEEVQMPWTINDNGTTHIVLLWLQNQVIVADQGRHFEFAHQNGEISQFVRLTVSTQIQTYTRF